MGFYAPGGAAGVAQAQGAPRTALARLCLLASFGALSRDLSIVFGSLSQQWAYDGMIVGEEGQILELESTYRRAGSTR
jgi:hypothetical protein